MATRSWSSASCRSRSTRPRSGTQWPAGAWCLQQYGCRIVWTYLSGDGRRCLCVFGAPDAESVRQAQKRMGMPYEAAWPATVHEPPSAP